MKFRNPPKEKVFAKTQLSKLTSRIVHLSLNKMRRIDRGEVDIGLQSLAHSVLIREPMKSECTLMLKPSTFDTLVEWITLQHRLNMAMATHSQQHRKMHYLQQHHKWWLAAVMEGTEAIDHVGWKHWKSHTPNFPEFEMELVDILHFALSSFLQTTFNEYVEYNRDEGAFIAVDDEHPYPEPTPICNKIWSQWPLSAAEISYGTTEDSPYDFVTERFGIKLDVTEAAKEFAIQAFAYFSPLIEVPTFETELDNDRIVTLMSAFNLETTLNQAINPASLFAVATQSKGSRFSGLDIDQLVADMASIYVPKNVLNLFRQANGEGNKDSKHLYDRKWGIPTITFAMSEENIKPVDQFDALKMEDTEVVNSLLKGPMNITWSAKELWEQLSILYKNHLDVKYPPTEGAHVIPTFEQGLAMCSKGPSKFTAL